MATDQPTSSDLAQSSAWAFALIIASNVLLFLIALLTARGLSLEGRGEFAVAAAGIQVAGWGLSGLSQSVVHHMTRLRLPEADVVVGGFVVALVLSLLVGLPGIAVGLSADGQWSTVGLAVAVATPALAARAVIAGRYLGRHNLTAYYAVGQLVSAAVTVALLTTAFIILDSESATLAIACLVGGIVASTIPVVSIGVNAMRRMRGRLESIGSQARFALVTGAIACATIANTRLDLLLVRGLLGADETAIYSVAQQIGEAAFLPVVAIAAASTAGLGAREPAQAAILAGRAVRHGVVVAMAAGVAVSAGAYLLAAPIFGERYSDVRELVPLISLSCVAFVPVLILTTAFAQTLSRPGLALLVVLLCLALQAATVPVAIEVWDETGAPLGRAAAYLLASALSVWLFARASGSSVAQLAAPRLSDLQSYRSLLRGLLAPGRHAS